VCLAVGFVELGFCLEFVAIEMNCKTSNLHIFYTFLPEK
jgi:hypothetical protein